MSNYNDLCDRIKARFKLSCGFFTAEYGFHRVVTEKERRSLNSYPEEWPLESAMACYLNGWGADQVAQFDHKDFEPMRWKLMDTNSMYEEMVAHGKELCDRIFDFLVEDERQLEEKRKKAREQKKFRAETKGTPDEVVSVRLSVREIKLAAGKLAKASPETSAKLLAAIPRRENGAIHGKS